MIINESTTPNFTNNQTLVLNNRNATAKVRIQSNGSDVYVSGLNDAGVSEVRELIKSSHRQKLTDKEYHSSVSEINKWLVSGFAQDAKSWKGRNGKL